MQPPHRSASEPASQTLFTCRSIGPVGRFGSTVFLVGGGLGLLHNAKTLWDAPGGPGFVIILPVVLDVLLVVVLILLWRRSRLRFEWASRVVVLEQSRWPFRRVERRIPLAEIREARVDGERTMKGGHVYWVVLVLASGEIVRLMRGGSSAKGYHERQANQIRALLTSAPGD